MRTIKGSTDDETQVTKINPKKKGRKTKIGRQAWKNNTRRRRDFQNKRGNTQKQIVTFLLRVFKTALATERISVLIDDIEPEQGI